LTKVSKPWQHPPAPPAPPAPADQAIRKVPHVLPELDLKAPGKLFIDGGWQDAAEGGELDAVCPANGEVIATVPAATAPDVDRAVRAAHAAFHGWSRTSVDERQATLLRFADLLEEQAARLTAIEVVDTGSTVARMSNDVAAGVKLIRMYAGLIRQLRGATIPVSSDMLAYTTREPFGVVGAIVPFNHPVMFAAQAIGVALAAGNTIVIKPSEYTPLTTLELGTIIAEVFPPGVVNLLTGLGPDCGTPLVQHPLTDKIHFRGSVTTGRLVSAMCAERGIPCTLELGGKNPFIVYPDADVAAAYRGAISGLNLGHQGQSCGSATRLFVHDDVYDEFRDGLVAEFEKVRVGLPWDPDSDMGAIISPQQYERVVSFLRSAHEGGARALVGGAVSDDPALPSGGLWVQPTIFEVDDPSMRVATEEIFGPVTCLMRWSDEDEVIGLANGLEYGLTASVWSRDLATALRTTDRLEAGVVWVNQHGPRPIGVPIGGQKGSGAGRELSIEELEGYTQTKSVMIKVTAT
jgi:betaine-aldehyde dehydrogenase